MKLVVIAILVIVAAIVLDRALLAAERRGWIYWRKRKSSPGTAAAAMMELHSMVEPDRAHVAEAIRAEAPEDDDEGDDFGPQLRHPREEARGPSGRGS